MTEWLLSMHMLQGAVRSSSGVQDLLKRGVWYRHGHRGGDARDAPPHQTYRGVDMTLDFIENHRQNIFLMHITP